MARKKVKIKKTKSYLVETPNQNYFGKTVGVLFVGGKALISEQTIDKFLGYSVEDVVKRMEKDFHYTITELVEE